MTRSAVCAVLVAAAACGTSSGPRAPSSPPPATDPDAGPGDGRLAPHTDAPAIVVRAGRGTPHASAIDRIALSHDGTAALSRDNLGGLRLWTALDGNAAPIRVPVHDVESFSVEPSGDGSWLVGVIDTSGAGHILRVDADGESEEQGSTPPHDPLEQLAVVPGGQRLVLLRADHTLALVDRHGTELATLEQRDFRPERFFLAADGRSMLAQLVETSATASTVSLPRIDVGGGETPSLSVAAGTAHGFTAAAAAGTPHTAISPSGDELAYAQRDPATGQWVLHAVDLATGTDRAIADRLVLSTPSLGYVSERQLVVAGGVSTWLADMDTGELRARAGVPSHVRGLAMPEAFAAGVRVTGIGTWLFVQDVLVDDVRYLGFGMFEPNAVSFSPAGTSVSWVDRSANVYVERLDDAGAPVVHYRTPSINPAWKVFFVDDDHLVFVDSLGGLRLVELLTNRALSEADAGGPAVDIEYRSGPRTIRVRNTNGETWIFEINEENVLVGPYVVADGSQSSFLLDAATATDPVLRTVDATGVHRTYTLAELRAGLTRDAMLERGDTPAITPGASLLTVAPNDARLYVLYGPTNQVTLEVYAGGALETAMPLAEYPMQLRVSPDGERIAVVGASNTTIQVYDRKSGKLAWSASMVANIGDIAWMPDSTAVAAVSSAGGSIFNAMSGAVIYQTCGPRFDARASAPDDLFGSMQQQNICDR